MVKFNELEQRDLESIVDRINGIFGDYYIDNESIKMFWEVLNIGNEKYNMV